MSCPQYWGIGSSLSVGNIARTNGKKRMSAKMNGAAVMLTRDFRVSNRLGLHARPAAKFVQTANRFNCDIFVEKDGQKINGKSIISLLVLSAGPGSKLTVSASGEDASEALAELELLVEKGFEEQ
jgi:phosphocarrier protein